MHVYGVKASPFVQRVLMTARAKGHELELRPPLGGQMISTEFQAISPMGRIPLLALDDGTHICESEAIAAYLDETLPGPSLLPDDPIARAKVRSIVSLAMCEVAGGERPLMKHLVLRMGDAPDIVAAARDQLAKGLDAIEKVRDAGDRFAIGDALTAADCVLLPVFTFLAVIGPIAGTSTVVAERPGLGAYYARMAAAPFAATPIEDMHEGFKAIVARVRAAEMSPA